MGRIHTLILCLSALILCSFVLLFFVFFDFHLCVIPCMLLCVLCGNFKNSHVQSFSNCRTADPISPKYIPKNDCNFGKNSSCLHNWSAINVETEQSGPSRGLAFSQTLPLRFPADSTLCSPAEPQTQERAPSGSNYCTTQPKWQMNKCHNTTACLLPLCSNNLTHTHTHTAIRAQTSSLLSTQVFTAGKQSNRAGEGCDRCTHPFLWRQPKRQKEGKGEGGWETRR